MAMFTQLNEPMILAYNSTFNCEITSTIEKSRKIEKKEAYASSDVVTISRSAYAQKETDNTHIGN